MDKVIVDSFSSQVGQEFEFLVSDYGFSRPIVEVDDATRFVSISFSRSNVAIELLFDEREEDVDCKIARIVGGRRSRHYAVDERGIRVRESLSALLRRRGVRSRLFTKVSGLRFEDRIKVALRDFAAMLSRYGTDILGDSPHALD